MTQYKLRTTLEKAPALINLVKSIKYSNRFKLNVKPSSRLQDQLVTQVLDGFLRTMKEIEQAVGE